MQNRRNLYRILHVQPDAPAPIIKSSYRTIMQTLRQHPDLGGEAEAAQLLNEAVAILCDPVRRADYDRERPRTTALDMNSSKPAAPLLPSSQAGTNPVAVNRACFFCEAPAPSITPSAVMPYADTSLCQRCGGARLMAAEQPDRQISTTRNEHRTALTAIATLWQDWPLSEPLGVRIVDLSAKGAALVCDTRINTNRTVLLISPLVNAIARIRYHHPMANAEQLRIGLTFLTLRMTAPPGELLALRV